MRTPSEEIVYFGRRMAARPRLNTAGGNISLRVEHEIHISPRYADYKWGWQLEPEQIVSGPINNDTLLANPAFSREGKAHLSIYRAFPEAQAIIHAHPHYVLPFCAAAKPIEPVLDAAEAFGVVRCTEWAAPNTQQLADNIVAVLRGQEEKMTAFAAAVLMPRHGIMVVGKDLAATFEALAKINENAWCILAGKLLG